MKSDKEILELIGLPEPKDYKEEQRKAVNLLNKQFIKIFKLGYKYGLMENAKDKLEKIFN